MTVSRIANSGIMVMVSCLGLMGSPTCCSCRHVLSLKNLPMTNLDSKNKLTRNYVKNDTETENISLSSPSL